MSYVLTFGEDSTTKIVGPFDSYEAAEAFRRQDADGYTADVRELETPILNTQPVNWRETS